VRREGEPQDPLAPLTIGERPEPLIVNDRVRLASATSGNLWMLQGVLFPG